MSSEKEDLERIAKAEKGSQEYVRPLTADHTLLQVEERSRVYRGTISLYWAW